MRKLALADGAEAPFLRPSSLALDESPTEPVLLHALRTAAGTEGIEHVILLPPTSPVRDDGSIDAAVQLYEQSGADSLVSVTEVTPLLWSGTPLGPRPLYDTEQRPRQQSVPELQRRYQENGSIVITSVRGLTETGNRICGRTVMFVMKPHEGIDVDSEYDLWLAGQWIRGAKC